MDPARWIVVDWIGTATNIRATAVPALERFGKRCRLNADWDHVMDACGMVQRIALDRIVAGEDPWRPQWQIIQDAIVATLEECGIRVEEIPQEAFTDLARFIAFMKPWDDAAHGVAMLRQLLPVALYSLSSLDALKLQTAEADITFDRLISAESYRSYPPAPEGFAGAARELGVPASETVFLSAHPPMLRGAAEAGMQVMQILRPMHETRLPYFEPTADLPLVARPRDLPSAAEWLAANLPRQRVA